MRLGCYFIGSQQPGLVDEVVALFFKSLFVFLPIAWQVMGGPAENQLTLLVAVFCLFQLLRIKGSSYLLSACWPMGLLILAYIGTRLSAPEVDLDIDTYDLRSAVYSLLYPIPAGVCLYHWSRNDKSGRVVQAYLVFGLLLAVASCYLIKVAGIENIVVVSNSGIDRKGIPMGVDYLYFFRITNIAIGIIAFTVFAMASVPILFLKCQNTAKITEAVALCFAIFCNLAMVTRTGFVAMGFALLSTFVLYQMGNRHRGSWSAGQAVAVGSGKIALGVVFSTIIAIAGVGFVLQTNATNLDYILQRFSKVGEDGRSDLMAEAWSLILQFPFGGGNERMTSLPWAHDIFLDFGLLGGFPAMAVAIVMALYGIKVLVAAARHTGIMTNPLGICLVSGLCAGFVVSCIQPPNKALIFFINMALAYSIGWVRDGIRNRRFKT